MTYAPKMLAPLRPLASRRTAVLAALTLSACQSPVVQTVAFSLDAPNHAGALLTTEGLAVANDYGTVVLLDPGARPHWRVPACHQIKARPVQVGDALVVTCMGGEWLALGLVGGKERWRSSLEHAVVTPLTGDDDRAYAIDQDGAVSSVDAATGALAWRRAPTELKGGKDRRFPAPVLWNGELVASLAEAGLYAFEPKQGTLRFRVSTRGVYGLLPLGDHLWVLWASGRLGALKRDGSFAWTRELGATVASGPTLAGGLVWIGFEDGLAMGFDPSDGSEKAHFALPGPPAGGVVDFDDVAVVPVGGSEGLVLGFKSGRPQAVFSVRLDSPIRSEPLVWGNTLFLAPADGRVLGFREEKSRQAKKAW